MDTNLMTVIQQIKLIPIFFYLAKLSLGYMEIFGVQKSAV